MCRRGAPRASILLRRCTLNSQPRGGDRLTRMALPVLGDMDCQTDRRGFQFRAANFADRAEVFRLKSPDQTLVTGQRSFGLIDQVGGGFVTGSFQRNSAKLFGGQLPPFEISAKPRCASG